MPQVALTDSPSWRNRRLWKVALARVKGSYGRSPDGESQLVLGTQTTWLGESGLNDIMHLSNMLGLWRSRHCNAPCQNYLLTARSARHGPRRCRINLFRSNEPAPISLCNTGAFSDIRTLKNSIVKMSIISN